MTGKILNLRRDCLVLEVDQSFLGGKSAGRPGPSSGKAPIMIAAERISAHRLGRIRLRVAKAPGTLELVDFACEVIEPGSVIRTDGAAMFRRLATLGYAHEPVAGNTAPDRDAVMPGAHLVSSLLKRWTAGTLHQRISPPAPAVLP